MIGAPLGPIWFVLPWVSSARGFVRAFTAQLNAFGALPTHVVFKLAQSTVKEHAQPSSSPSSPRAKLPTVAATHELSNLRCASSQLLILPALVAAFASWGVLTSGVAPISAFLTLEALAAPISVPQALTVVVFVVAPISLFPTTLASLVSATPT